MFITTIEQKYMEKQHVTTTKFSQDNGILS